MIARVRSVTASSTFAGSKLHVEPSMSTKTGTAPTRRTAVAVATKLMGGTITSSPLPIPAA